MNTSPADQPGASDLFLIAVNLTKRCNLACAHCYMDAETLKHGGHDELTTAEVRNLLTEIAGRSTETMVVLTGGEPLMRPDLEELLGHGSGLGLSMVVLLAGRSMVKAHEGQRAPATPSTPRKRRTGSGSAPSGQGATVQAPVSGTRGASSAGTTRSASPGAWPGRGSVRWPISRGSALGGAEGKRRSFGGSTPTGWRPQTGDAAQVGRIDFASHGRQEMGPLGPVRRREGVLHQ